METRTNIRSEFIEKVRLSEAQRAERNAQRTAEHRKTVEECRRRERFVRSPQAGDDTWMGWIEWTDEPLPF